MKQIATYEDLGPENIVQVVIWSKSSKDPLSMSHSFSITGIRIPAYCRQCKTLMWNMRRSYYRCADCKASVHEKCIHSFASGCGGRFCSAKLNSVSPTDFRISSSLTNSPVRKRLGKLNKPESALTKETKIPTTHNIQMSHANSHNMDIPWMNRGMKNIKVDDNKYSGIYVYVDGFNSKRVNFIFDSKSDILDLRMEDGQHLRVTRSHIENQGSIGPMSDIDVKNICKQIRSGLENVNFQKGIKSSFRLTSKKDKKFDFDDIFEIDTKNILGAGRFGKVYCGYYKETKRMVAIKKVAIRNDPTNITSTYDEALLLFELDYPGILKCEGIFQRPDCVILVTEKLDVDMLDYILRSEDPPGRLSEMEAKNLCFQISIAIRYLHSKDIAHCDLKPENVLLKLHPGNIIQTKIADFGYARIIKDGAVRHTLVGTLAYLPPEVSNNDLRRHQGYNRSLDIWSFGVISYVSLCGFFPYRDDSDLVEQIMANKNLFSGDVWRQISHSAKGYISEKLLVPDAGRRSNSQSLIYHEWFTKDTMLLKSLSILESTVGLRWMTDEFQESPPESSESDASEE